MPVKHARSQAEIARCYPVMAALRPHVPEAGFVELVLAMQQEGYRLGYLEHQGQVAAVAGYRITTNLHLGRNLYIDDLVTRGDMRSRGLGAALLDALRAVARESGCAQIHLDSGTQRHRAHRFYFREGMAIESFHFYKSLE